MQPNIDLREILHFTDADLALNRQGQLTPTQIEFLRKSIRGQELGCFVFSLVFSGFAILIVGQATHNLMVGVAGGIIALALAVAMMFYASRRSAQSFANGTVMTTRGLALRQTVKGRGKSIYYYVTIGEKRFLVTPQLYRAFQDGSEYIAYYVVLYDETLVSAEVITDPLKSLK
ncbi:MAG: hypothetical protein ABI947_26975 [Chloroflexota bacterium]